MTIKKDEAIRGILSDFEILSNLVLAQLDLLEYIVTSGDISVPDELLKKINNQEKEIDKKEVKLSDKVVNTIVLYHPVASELRKIMACYRIVISLERIGDLVLNVTNFINKIKTPEVYDKLQEVLHNMVFQSNRMVKKSLLSFLNDDRELAIWTLKNEAGSDAKVSLTAAGATFPMPYYNMVFKKYTGESGILLSYGGIGSGGGIRSLGDKIVDFGATDAYLSDTKLSEMPAEVVHIPTCLGAVVIAYNLPGVEELKLSNTLLEGIFMGEITNWNDPAIASNNPGTTLPDTEITFIHRSDGSGTTYIFSDFMSKISQKWANEVGSGKSLKWPTGMGAKGNPGVAGTISQTEGAVGYIGSEFAFAQKIKTANVQNISGAYVEPSIESISAAAQGEIPSDTRVMLTNSSNPASYPISGFTWIILYKEQSYDNRSKAQASATVEFLDWLISENAQAEASKVNYAPLPADAVSKAKVILRGVTYGGEALLK